MSSPVFRESRANLKPRGKAHRDGLARAILWGSIALAGLLFYLDTSPIELDSDESFEGGTSLVLEAVSDVLLVVDYDTYKDEPESFAELDFSLAWLNTLQQELGPIALRDAESLADIELSNYRLVILTRSASGNDAWLPKLEGFVDRGGTLVLEMPSGAIRKAFSADGQGGVRDPQRITMANGLATELQAALEELPLATDIIGSAGPLEGAETVLTIDGVPVIYRKQLGVGWAITVDFDYGMVLTSIQQGQPTDGFRLRNHRGTNEIESSDLVFDESLIGSMTPIADVLERFMVYGAIGEVLPQVGFWPFLDGMDGAFVVSHDTGNMGDDAAWMARYEAAFNGSSSYFLRTPGPVTRAGVEELVHLGADVGIEWNRSLGGGGVYEPIGMWGIEPVSKALTLDDQSSHLRSMLEDLSPLVSVRCRGNLWGRDWVDPFRAMAAVDLRTDSTYAAPEAKPGYSFGTGMPFMPLDKTGLGFNLLEFPVLLIATGRDLELSTLSEMLRQSSESFHEALGVSFAPDIFVEAPSAEFYRTWRDAYRFAAEKGHWITSVRNLYRFSRARHNSELRSRRSDSVINGREVVLLRLESLALEIGMTVSVPESIDEKTFVEARRGLNRVQGDSLLSDQLDPKPVSVMGYTRVLLPLSKGFNAIDVVYE
ncbi:MAG: hypothetical protein CO108_10645 [Deltaproteobacteria bacterium CG_4_9_14_3_um_filter_63_12]|nr:MAG: hypothetical protein CO108_10645 [Deltaproteobacteria bacterium CG_4_9_14_3_um_filter_63_12]